MTTEHERQQARWPEGSGNPLDDVRDTVRLMRTRMEDGQGGLTSAMCRLSLPMSEFLIEQLDLAAKVHEWMSHDAESYRAQVDARAAEQAAEPRTLARGAHAMSYTMKPTIANARKAAEAFNARQVVVVAFDYNGRFAVTSYGVTKEECKDIARLCDAIADGLNAGTLPAPEVNR